MYRRISNGRRRVKRFFNDAGDGARADELEPMAAPVPMAKCDWCDWTGPASELVIDDTGAPDRVKEVCPNCGEDPSLF